MPIDLIVAVGVVFTAHDQSQPYPQQNAQTCMWATKLCEIATEQLNAPHELQLRSLWQCFEMVVNCESG